MCVLYVCLCLRLALWREARWEEGWNHMWLPQGIVAAEWGRLLHDMEHFVSGSCRTKRHDASWIQRQWHSYKQSDCQMMNMMGTAGVFVPDIATSKDS